jgi:predicted N-acetyltransferase YhbS
MRSRIGIPRKYGAALSIELVASEKDFAEMLDVRYKAFRFDGRHLKLPTPKDMEDAHDRTAYILAAKLGGTVVGTVRCVEPTLQNPEFPFEQSIPLPPQYDEKRLEYFELSKLAISPRFRRSDIQKRLMQHMTARVICNKRGAFCTATGKYAAYYSMIGAEKLSRECAHPINEHELYALYLFDVDSFLRGVNMTSDVYREFAVEAIALAEAWQQEKSGTSADTCTKVEHMGDTSDCRADGAGIALT